MWESSGWIKECDPYGWFMWYTRFYLGRRTDDDERQIGRWKALTGDKVRHLKPGQVGQERGLSANFMDRCKQDVFSTTRIMYGL